MSVFVSSHLPALVWAAAIWLLLAVPSSATGLVAPWLAALWFPGLDKLGHAALFAVLALLTARSMRSLPEASRPLLSAFVLASAYGLATEAGQGMWTDRAAELGDAVADAAGAGLACWLLWRRGAPSGAAP